MTKSTRGFLGRPRRGRDVRLPPGQYDVGSDFPALSAEATPRLDPDRWTMSVNGLVANPHTWSWQDLHRLTQSEYRGDIHCFWKSAKWLTSLNLLDHDEPGFWERNGFHDLGDPWREQRYQGD